MIITKFEVIFFTFEGLPRCHYSPRSVEKAMRTIKHLADVAGQRVFADFGTFVLEHLVRSAEQRTGHR